MRIPSEERKEQLIAATVELMKREGVQSVTMRAIAKEANAPLATAHYCFDNKDVLMEAAAGAWLKNLGRFSRDLPLHLGLRKTVEQVADGYWHSLVDEPASLLAEFELILWATRNIGSSHVAGKIYPAYVVELGNLLSSAAENDSENCQMEIATLVRSFLMIFDGAAIQYITDPQATDHRGNFLMMVDALLIKAGL
ncbi:TetR/AcrR family transcriptional regulator [Paenarthrobacter sp. NPDC056912]|uniref:TetR/AcrR family transcriptional regulator n=1 Tax=Paenarthrobacter sp. NPDC056912 TaxID=3345965 RepID=UPI00366DDFAB